MDVSYEQVAIMLANVYAKAGVKISGKDIIFKEAAKDVLRSLTVGEFRYFDVTDITIAMNKGIKGEYGEYHGLNAVTFHKFLKGYEATYEYRMKFQQVNRPKELQPKIPSDIERLREHWKNFINGNEMMWESGWTIFDLLVKLEKIHVSDKELEEKINQAKQKIIQEKKEAISKRPTERSIFKEFIQEINSGKKEDIAIMRAKSDIARQFFEKERKKQIENKKS